MAGDYFALRKALSRTHGLSELEQVCRRQPENFRGAVIGNPRHEGTINLPAAGAEANALCAQLKTNGWTVRNAIRMSHGYLSGAMPTTETVVNWLSDEPFGLLVFSAHGRPMSVLLEGRDELTDQTVISAGLKGSPLVHFDCCWAGINMGTGGGRYIGMPVAALRAGASAVVASAHPVYDKHAAQFTNVLYTGLLEHGQSLGDALLAARQALAGNPLHWATTVLWGNPKVRLRS